MDHTPTLLIYNIHSMLNGGDRALLECALEQIRAHFPGAGLILLVNWPAEPYFQNGDWEVLPSAWVCCGVTQNWPIWKQITAAAWGWAAAFLEGRLGLRLARGSWGRLFAAYRRADLVVGVGGNQHFSTGRFGWPFPVTALAPALARIFGKPLYTLPQSWGPLKRGWERLLMRAIYAGSRRVLLRDAISLQLARDLGLPPQQAIYLPDLAFDFPPAPPAEALAILARYGYTPGQAAVGATILADPGRALSPEGKAAYYHVFAEVLRRLAERCGATVYVFIQVAGPTPQEDDRLGARRVLAEDAAGQIRLVDELLSPAQLKACYGYMELFLPTRLHSGIFALSMNVACVFVGYLTKTRGVLQSLGLEDWMVDIAGIDLETFWAKIETAWQERHQRSAHLAARLPGVIAEARRAGGLIAEDFGRDA